LVAQIFISAPKGNPDASKEKAAAKKLARVRELLARAGADFSAIAKAESEDAASAAQGGEIGWLAEEQIQPEIRTQLPKLRINALSEPLRLDDGWHIIKVLDVREAHTPLLEQVRTQLVQQLRSERERQNREAYISKLLEASPLAINEATLSELNAKKAK
jgi:parvulin-like peptidyl-prolyl isomerase